MSLSLANLGGASIFPFWAAWLDIAGDPVRAVTIPGGHTFSGTGDADLDGQTFLYLPSELVTMGDVVSATAGVQNSTMTLAGISGTNDDLLTALAANANWQGRVARRWTGLTDGHGTILEVASDLTGYIMTCALTCDPLAGGTVSASIENYLAVLTAARTRDYQDQGEFDPSDVSGPRIRAAANGLLGTALAGLPQFGTSAAGGGGGIGGGALGLGGGYALR